MREEFQKRRGYDPLPWLPVVTGRVVDSLEVSERFLWDLRQTVSELVVENYAGRMRELAHEHGLRLSIEAYGGPPATICLTRAGPTSRCANSGSAAERSKRARKWPPPRTPTANRSSAPNRSRPPIRNAGSNIPPLYKSLGDRVMCDGVNRFVFHRYAMQPWLNYKPGMTMGPWGLHYERTETWWGMIKPWHEYLARCHYLLRQGLFVADICYLQPEAAPQGYQRHERHGYDFDNCSRRGRPDADEGERRPHRPARRHELRRARAAEHDGNDAGTCCGRSRNLPMPERRSWGRAR